MQMVISELAEKLCGVAFQRSGIIRSTEKRPAMEDFLDFAPALFEELQRSPDISSVLARYHADFAPVGSEGEKALCAFLAFPAVCFASEGRTPANYGRTATSGPVRNMPYDK